MNEGDPMCKDCFNNSLELNVKYKKVESERYYVSGKDIGHLFAESDYPLSAEWKCTVCGHVVDKWEYEERKHNGKD